MSEKLSERLERASADKALPIGEAWALLEEAARIVRAVEDADQYLFAERSRHGCAVLVALPSFYGKVVKLVEVG